MSARFVAVAWAIVIAATLVRLVVAARLPLSGDEAYYWEWSRRLAFGYFDHPPMVAWVIALFSFGLKNTLLIRLPFVLCGLGCAAALYAFVARATGDARAGATAALLIALAPFSTIAFATATPDGPFLFFWSLSLYLALRSVDPTSPSFRIPLALSVAGATLSRLFGAALALGIAYALGLNAKKTSRDGTDMQPARYSVIPALLFLASIAPYIVWGASHSWSGLRFALLGRHDATFHGGIILYVIGLYGGAPPPGLLVAALAAVPRLTKARSPAELLLIATAAPLLIVCLALALRERVEFYWADGAL